MRHTTFQTRETQARLRAPAAIVEIDLADRARDAVPAATLPRGAYKSLYALVSRGGEPLGVVTVDCEHPGVSAGDAFARAVRRLEAEVRAAPECSNPELAARASRLTVSVVVTTCAKPAQACRCVASILAGAHAPLEVIVVENRPDGSRTAELLRRRFHGDPRVRYVDEPARGLSRARNAGLREAGGEVVAFTDDDVVVDRRWLDAIATSFAMAPATACVTGPILPLALETDEQLTFEQFGALGKGFRRRVYAADPPPDDDALFPYAAGQFGSGANIAMRARVARAMGGFDVRLGAGTPARGGEDLDLFVRVLQSGGTIVYEPRALLRHEHGRSRQDLRRHAFDYGAGLTAMLTKHLLSGKDRFDLLRRVPVGIRYALDPASHKNAGKGPDYPKRLDWLERLGMSAGPLCYLASRHGARKAAS